MRRLSLIALAVMTMAVVCKVRCRAPQITLATFNIEKYPRPETNDDRVAELIAEVDADVLAVQEIRDPGQFARVLENASHQTGRDYQLVLSPCVQKPRFFSPGIVYDADVVDHIETLHFPELDPDGGGSCSLTALPGVLTVLESGSGQRFAALSIHFRAFPEKFEERKEQWRRVVRIVEKVEREHDAHVVALGDANTTGFRGEPPGERAFVDQTLADAGLRLVTADIPCSEYWRKKNSGPFLPSVLDHIVVRHGTWSEPEPLGMCAELECRQVAADDMHEDHARVSDHCPVRIEGRF